MDPGFPAVTAPLHTGSQGPELSATGTACTLPGVSRTVPAERVLATRKAPGRGGGEERGGAGRAGAGRGPRRVSAVQGAQVGILHRRRCVTRRIKILRLTGRNVYSLFGKYFQNITSKLQNAHNVYLPEHTPTGTGCCVVTETTALSPPSAPGERIPRRPGPRRIYLRPRQATRQDDRRRDRRGPGTRVSAQRRPGLVPGSQCREAGRRGPALPAGRADKRHASSQAPAAQGAPSCPGTDGRDGRDGRTGGVKPD